MPRCRGTFRAAIALAPRGDARRRIFGGDEAGVNLRTWRTGEQAVENLRHRHRAGIFPGTLKARAGSVGLKRLPFCHQLAGAKVVDCRERADVDH